MVDEGIVALDPSFVVVGEEGSGDLRLVPRIDVGGAGGGGREVKSVLPG